MPELAAIAGVQRVTTAATADCRTVVVLVVNILLLIVDGALTLLVQLRFASGDGGGAGG